METLCITIAANIAKTGVLKFEACFPDGVVGFVPGDDVATAYVQGWLSFYSQHWKRTRPKQLKKH